MLSLFLKKGGKERAIPPIPKLTAVIMDGIEPPTWPRSKYKLIPDELALPLSYITINTGPNKNSPRYFSVFNMVYLKVNYFKCKSFHAHVHLWGVVHKGGFFASNIILIFSSNGLLTSSSTS